MAVTRTPWQLKIFSFMARVSESEEDLEFSPSMLLRLPAFCDISRLLWRPFAFRSSP
jgi:hypothetical protein